MTTPVRYIIGDTETTGIDRNRKAVEIAMIEIDEDLNELDRLCQRLDPQQPISPEAEATHGISLESLQDEPTIEEFVEHIMGGPLDGEIVLIGHRILFDLPMFHPLVMPNVRNVFDTLEFAHDMAPKRTTAIENHKLSTLKAFFNIESGESHSALGDCETCLGLLRLWLPQTGRTLADLCAPGPKVIHHMPWGKHEGTPLVDLEKSYRAWLLGLHDLSPNLRFSLMQLRNAGI